MDTSNLTDIGAGLALFLFAGAETISIDTTFEIISKFGVVAVLWFWLKDIRKQMKEQLLTYEKNTESLRLEHKEQLKHLSDVYEDYKDRLEKQLDKNK